MHAWCLMSLLNLATMDMSRAFDILKASGNDIFKMVMFVMYLIISITFLSFASQQEAQSCFVQNTYRQEFLGNIQSNPFYFNSIELNGGPVSQYEVRQNASKMFEHKERQMAIFPVMHRSSDSAFMSEARPKLSEPRPNPVHFAMYTYDAKTGTILKVPGLYLGDDMHMESDSAVADKKNGHMPGNYERCIMDSMDIGRDEQRKMLLASTHRAGTCLLTAQQAVVDVSSRYRSSTTLFSSVNLLFMVWVVMWISSSFALFYMGQHSFTPANDTAKKLFNFFAAADFVVGLCVGWNIILIGIIATTYTAHHIPANNAVLAILASLWAMVTHAKWANFKVDADDKERAGGYAVLKKAEVEPTLRDARNEKPMEESSVFNTSLFFMSAMSRKDGFQRMSVKNMPMHLKMKSALNGDVVVTGGFFTEDDYAKDMQVMLGLHECLFAVLFSKLIFQNVRRIHMSTATCRMWSTPSPQQFCVLLCWDIFLQLCQLEWCSFCLST